MKDYCPACGKKKLKLNIFNGNLECLNCLYIHKPINEKQEVLI